MEDVEYKRVAPEKDASVDGVKLDKELEQEKNACESKIPADHLKKGNTFI